MSNTVRLKLSDLENLDENIQDKLIAEFASSFENTSAKLEKETIMAELAILEKFYGKSSEQMLAELDCQKRLSDPKLNRWATLYSCLKNVA